MVVTVFVWYGPTISCCACGETWNDGYRYRPFERGWRKSAIADARTAYATATDRKTATSGLLAEVQEYINV
jgi:hypothetical protein